MLFEEFFKKKKINLATLEQGQPELFLEFKEHYAQMGEKSFDHTKKYWFNRLRHEYPLPVEVKTEKVHIENQIAEQTVAEALTEPTPQAEPAKLGFRPKFKAAATPAANPAESIPAPQAAEDLAKQDTAETPQAEQPAAEPAKMGFKPRFKAGVTKSAEGASSAPAFEATNNTDSTPTEQPSKLGFKPRFKAGVTGKPAEENSTSVEPSEERNTVVENATPVNDSTSAEVSADEPTNTPPKLGFKPRFKAGVTTSKPAQEKPTDNTTETQSASAETEPAKEVKNESTEQTAAPKLGFKPRFKAGVTNTKPVEEKPFEPAPESDQETKAETSIETQVSEGGKLEEPAAPKLGFKPRFKAGITTTKPAPVEEEKQQETTPTTDAVAPVSETEENPAPAPPATPPAKQPYKPRFNPNMMKPKPPAEGE